MSVILYKLGEDPIYVPPERLSAHLEGGWSVEDPNIEQSPSDEDLSNADIRAKAKEAGIDGWETLRIATLKEKLGMVQDSG